MSSSNANDSSRTVARRLSDILGFSGIAPRVSNIIIASIASSFLLFFASINLFGYDNFNVFLKQDVSGAVRDALDREFILAPILISAIAALIALVLSLIVIRRARRRGAVVFSTNGVLHHHNQINISMRVATLHTMLRPVAALVGEKELDAAFHKGGLAAGKAFAVAFPLTYRERIQEGSLPDWDDLSFDQRLKFWQRYDETSGWGDIDVNHRDDGKTLLIQIYHPTLFRDVIGNAWSHFMAGYIEAFLGDIAKPRGSVKYDGSVGIENNGVYISLQFRRN